MSKLEQTLISCEQKIQKFYDYEIKLYVLPTHPTTLQSILDYSLQQTGCTIKDLHAENQSRKCSEARQIYCYLAKKHTKYSLDKIGELINRSHSNVIYSINTITNLLEQDKIFRNTYLQTINEFKTISTES